MQSKGGERCSQSVLFSKYALQAGGSRKITVFESGLQPRKSFVKVNGNFLTHQQSSESKG
ncbi:hypothetical protein T03_4941 [Trichinella britovi]|uniref:Uncharacterized protein n=1 Tax=Trichinella britovi TaxID=45882 RepID=A0A0V1CEZ9_TRIBR|nr:hypothetical protein T03_4941 [Trichinella britovi]